jgi:hypothetical protein
LEADRVALWLKNQPFNKLPRSPPSTLSMSRLV